MGNNTLKTSADELYELVKSKKKISVEEAAKKLKLPNNIVQSLVDFLVEERIFGIEYKFTTPYIYLSQKKEENTNLQPNLEKKLITKEEFFKKAGKLNISFEKTNDLWKKYIQENIDSIKESFYVKARSKNISKERIDNLWIKYLAHLQ